MTFILFKTAEEFQQRPNYRAELTVLAGELADFIGKYSFPSDKKIRCGLNGCGVPHMTGFVVVTKDGRETHCGQVCGKRELGRDWEEIEAAVKARADRAEVDARLAALFESLPARTAAAKAALTNAAAASKQMHGIIGAIESDLPLSRAFAEALRLQGEIRRVRTIDEEQRLAMGLKTRQLFEEVARFEGVEAAQTFRSITSTLEREAVRPLEGLSRESLAALPVRELNEALRLIENTQGVVNRADRFLSVASIFVAPGNVSKLLLLREALAPRDITRHTERALKLVAAHASGNPGTAGR